MPGALGVDRSQVQAAVELKSHPPAGCQLGTILRSWSLLPAHAGSPLCLKASHWAVCLPYPPSPSCLLFFWHVSLAEASPCFHCVLGFICLRWASPMARGKESACDAGNAGDTGSIPGSGRSPGEGNGNPLQYSCLENPMDRGYSHGVAESDTTGVTEYKCTCFLWVHQTIQDNLISKSVNLILQSLLRAIPRFMFSDYRHQEPWRNFSGMLPITVTSHPKK